ncbi:MAG: hypothetical protein VXZ82_20415 [Planctomycetota bacterium]|nr:hypothetical protein [Planctomycetota bacterium]
MILRLGQTRQTDELLAKRQSGGMNLDRISKQSWTLLQVANVVWFGGISSAIFKPAALILLSLLPLTALANNNSSLEYNLLDMPNARVSINKLNQSTTLLWQNKPLRQGMQELAKSHRLSLWIDRRIDPNQLLKMQTDQSDTLATAIERLGKEFELDLGLLESVLYVGPANTLPRLQRAHVVLHDALSKHANQARTEMRVLQWEELATPMSLVQQLESSWSISVSAKLPHDLMHEGTIENCTLATQLVLIGSGFGIEPFWNERESSLGYRLLSSERAWSCSYESKSLGPIARRTADLAKLARRHKGKVTRRGELTLVSGPTALHQALLAQPASGGGTPKNAFANSVYSFEVKNEPVEVVLNSLAGSLGLKLKWDSAVADEQRKQRISLDIKNAKVDELLMQFGQHASLKMERANQTITIRP